MAGLTPNALGTLYIVGHSYTSGAGTTNSAQQGLVSRIMGMMKVDNNNVVHMGVGASLLTGYYGVYTGNPFAGWGGVLQLVLPNSQPNINGVGDKVYNDHAASGPGSAIIVHGVNDYNGSYLTSMTNVNTVQPAYVQQAWKNALRTVISRMRANVVFSSSMTAATGTTISWDPAITFGGSGGSHWSDVASVITNTGPAYKKSTTNGDTVTFTIPNEGIAGTTYAFCMIGQLNMLGYITANLNATDTTSTVTVNSATGFPNSFIGSQANVIQIGTEQMLVTAGWTTTSWTVTRGFNGTTKTTHAIGDAVSGAANMTVTWSGTASSASGTTTIGSQGMGGSPVSVIKRFTTTAADAGKTIVATFSGIPASDAFSYFAFDSVWSEAPYPSPVVLTNLHHYPFGQNAGTQLISLIPGFNSATQSVVSEFDANVQIADVYSLYYQNNGTITSATNNTDTSTTIGWTCNSTAYTPYIGAVMSFGGEHCLVTAVSGTAPNWTLTLTRGYDSTTKYAWASGSWLCPTEWMSRIDDVHPSAEGHAVYADAIYAAFKSIPTSTVPHQIALSNGNWALYNQSLSLGPVDNSWYHVAASSLTTSGPTINTLYFLPIYIPKVSILIGMGFTQKTGTTVTCRFGIFGLNQTHEAPGALLQDFGSGTYTGTAPYAVQQTGLYQILRPGWYWLGVVSTVNAGTSVTVGNLGLNWPSLSASAISTSSTAAFTTGYSQASVTGALPTTATATATTSTAIPLLWYQLRTGQWS